MVAMKGRPKRANGCLARAARYLAGMVESYAAARNFFVGKMAIVRYSSGDYLLVRYHDAVVIGKVPKVGS